MEFLNPIDHEPFRELAQSLVELQMRAERKYASVVNHLIQSNCQDVHEIESALDGLLSFAQGGEGLMLYRFFASATASRDLSQGVEMGLLSKTGDKRLTEYHFVAQSIPRES